MYVISNGYCPGSGAKFKDLLGKVKQQERRRRRRRSLKRVRWVVLRIFQTVFARVLVNYPELRKVSTWTVRKVGISRLWPVQSLP